MRSATIEFLAMATLGLAEIVVMWLLRRHLRLHHGAGGGDGRASR